MYNTVKEMHIALDMGLQHINSNRKQSITPYHKDMALNYAVLQFIENRTNPTTNVRKEGLEDTQKRYDDIRELKASVISNTLVDDNVFAILPKDYYKLISAGARVKYFKSNKVKPNSTRVYHYYKLKLPNDASGKYRNFKIIKYHNTSSSVIFNSTVENLPDFYTADAKFMLVNSILNTVDEQVYWEKWNDVYAKDSFIIIGDSGTSYTITYDGQTSNSNYNTAQYNSYVNQPGDNLVPIDLISSEHEFESSSNYYTSKNRHYNPKGSIFNNRLVVYENDNFIISFVVFNYYKKPKLINHRTNQSCEISVNREIVDLALQKLKAYIKDEGYQHIVNENQIME